jgi:hypothetical protein
MEQKLRIHIAVVGFEIDRISQAAISLKADRVYLISKTKNDKGSKYLLKNEEILNQNRIDVKIETVDDVQDQILILRKMKKIILQEKNNLIYVNISSGSTLAAIAGTIVSTMFEKDIQITPYYVKPKSYEAYTTIDENELQPQTTGIEEIREICAFPAKLPDDRLTKVLIEIHQREYLTKQDLIEFSIQELGYNVKEENEEEKKETKKGSNNMYSPREYAWVEKNIVEKLNKWEFVVIQKDGKKSKIYLTEKGKNMVEYLRD